MVSHRSAHRANVRRPQNWLPEPLESRRLLSSAAVFGAVDRFTVDSTVGGQLVRLGDYGYFSAGPAAGDYALYRTDLTPSGTAPVLGNFTTAPYSIVNVNNTLLFLAADASHGLEIWRSDGTAAGTAPVTDFASANAQIGSLTAGPGGQAFFTLLDGASGNELWRTDGTAGGTRLVKDINPGAASSEPTPLAVLGDRFLFTAYNGARWDLWATDGTEANTVIIPAQPSNVNGFRATGPSLVTSGGRVFFAAEWDTGVELWTTDGTAAGTYPVKDIFPGHASSSPTAFTEFNGKVYFSADDGIHGRELWVTDGTAAGTHLAVDLVPGAPGAPGANVLGTVAMGGRLYVAGVNLYSTDGTAAGTVQLASGLPEMAGLSVVGNQVFFVAAASPGAGHELWASGGSPATTRPVADIFPGPGEASPRVVGVLGDKVLFAGNDGSHGTEPWVSDGTAAGTQLLRDTATATVPLKVDRTLVAGDVLYVMGRVGTKPTNVLLATDGTGPGTRLLAVGADYIYAVRGNGNRIFFGGSSGVWTSEGTPQSTVRLTTDVVPDPFISGSYHHVAFAGGNFYYVKRIDPRTWELWKTDGTTGGTSSVLHLASSDAIVTIAYLQSVGQRLFFYRYDANVGYEPWVSDGTSQGTMILKDINPGPRPSALDTSTSRIFEAPAGGRLYFLADDGTVHNGLWVTDGTPDGTRFIKDLVPGSSDLKDPTFAYWDAAGQTVFFTFFGSPSGGIGVWRSDGTPAGTSVIIDSGPGYWQYGVAVWNGGVFYAVPNPSPTLTRNTLYRYDLANGTLAALGTFASQDGSPSYPVAMPDGVYFEAATAESGMELWRTDGTVAGTAMVVDAVPGPATSYASALSASAFHGAVWFSAGHLWVTPDIVPPTVTAATFSSAAKPSVNLQFDQNLAAPPTPDDFTLVNPSTGAPIAASGLQVDYDSITCRATVTLMARSGQPLNDGDYRLILRGGSVTDAVGNPLPADYTFDFFVLAGDANHDRSVDFNDLVKLAQNYNTTGSKTYAQGDFTGDGNVDFNDLVILAQRYNTSLPAPGATAGTAALTSSFAADWATATSFAPLPTTPNPQKKKVKPIRVFSVTLVTSPMPVRRKTPVHRLS